MKLKLNPTQEAAIFLGFYSALALSFNFQTSTFVHLACTLGFGLVLFWFFAQISGKKKVILNTVITTLIIFAVLNYPITLDLKSIAIPLIATFIAVFWKFFLEKKGSPIVNPVVTALLLTALIMYLLPFYDDAFISWWGAGFRGNVSLIPIVLWCLIGIRKWRKYTILFTFLIAHLILTFIFNSPEAAKFIFTDATIYFFAGIMLIEPKTSPILKKDQVIYGLIAAIAYTVFLKLGISFVELWAIAAANIYFFGSKVYKKHMRAKAAPPPAPVDRN